MTAGISIPLVIVALYVNKLRARARVLWKQLLRALSDPDTLLDPIGLDDPNNDHDSDEERTFVEQQTHKALTEVSGPDHDSETPQYAPMFGKWHFHSGIPWFRRLWLLQHYRRASVKKRNNRWKDRYVTDYPLHYHRVKLGVAILTTFIAVLAWFGYGKKTGRKVQRRKKAGSDSSSSSSSDGSDSSDRDEKGGPRKSIDSGYWKRGEGSGLAGDSWSNQTRSRGSRDDEQELGKKKKRVGWLRVRRRAKAKKDEEFGDGEEVRSV